jgi:simple sugar transport system ATP-binding protein
MDVELRNIHKRFGAVHANNGISIVIPSGTIQGVLGENGAGKSTLMKVLSGFIQQDEGDILLDGKPVRIDTPADAIRHGIGMLHQDPLDFPPMRVLDNFILGREGGLFPDYNKARKEFTELIRQFDFSIDPDTYVDTLTVGERQQLEILRLLWLGARCLILDEPTTGISALQKAKLFATLKKLASQGMTLIFVSHKLEEVEGLCHRVMVMRQGKLVGEARPPYVTDELVNMMFGKVVALDNRQNAAQDEIVLEICDLCLEDYRLRINDVNLNVKRGEVIGLAGMEGSGQRHLLRSLGGLFRAVGGKIRVNGKDLTSRSYKAYLEAGIAYMPAARLEEGLIPGLTLTEHFILAEEQEGFLINRDKARATTQNRIQEFSVRGTAVNVVEDLSGGNQQRVLLAMLKTPLKLLLLEHPTRGLDIESSIWIWSKLKERCKQGTTIIFISSDPEEILHYSDRILVFFGGKVFEPLDAAQTSVEQLGQLIGGKGVK